MKIPVNPYIIAGKNSILPSYCVYMDILGLREETEKAFEDDKGQELFDSLNAATFRAYDFIKDEDYNLWQHKIFTDNIVMGFPIHKDSDGETEFGILISQLIYYQLIMALEGFFVRGAFSIGYLYVGEDIVYGPAVLEAYKLESELANNPRIIFSEDVMTIVKEHLKYYGNPKESPQNADIMMDADGQCFVNYLYGTIDNDEGFVEYDRLKKHKKNIEHRLTCFRDKSHIWSKYLWVANYHNYFCKLISGCINFKDDLFIDTALMTHEPRRLVE